MLPADPHPHPTSRPWRSRSLRRDLALGFGLGIMLVWFLALLVGWAALRREIDEIYDAALSRTADRLLAVDGTKAATPRRDDLLAEWIAGDGSLRFRSSGVAAGRDGGVLGQTEREGLSEAGDLRILTLRGADGSLLKIADPLKERREAARETLIAMLMPSLLLMPLAFGAAIWFTRRRLAPVSALSHEVAVRDARDLRPLSPQPLPAELEPIRSAVNQLMRQLDEALLAERAFSANAAHELRTPLAAALAQSQRLIAEAPNPALRSRAEAVAAELQRLSRLSAKLLDLARAEGLALLTRDATDMAPVLRLIAGDYGDQVEVVLGPEPVLLPIDIDAFAILARNLIENAVVHGEPPVRVSLSPDALQVENGGPVVAAAQLTTLTRRFQRGAPRSVESKAAPTAGAGLGLAIVEALVRNINAELQLRSPRDGQRDGFSARVSFAKTQA